MARLKTDESAARTGESIMIDKVDFDELDGLLENPALIADRDFSEGVQRRLNLFKWSRAMVFFAMTSIWLALAALNWSPDFVTTSMQSLFDISNWIGSQIIGFSGLGLEIPDPKTNSLPGVLVVVPVLGLLIYQLIADPEI